MSRCLMPSAQRNETVTNSFKTVSKHFWNIFETVLFQFHFRCADVFIHASNVLYIGWKFQSVSTISWTLLCNGAYCRKLRGTWSTVAHRFRKSPAVDNYTQPVDSTIPCHSVTCWALSGAGPFQSSVKLCGTLYWIVSMIQHSVLKIFYKKTAYNGTIRE